MVPNPRKQVMVRKMGGILMIGERNGMESGLMIGVKAVGGVEVL